MKTLVFVLMFGMMVAAQDMSSCPMHSVKSNDTKSKHQMDVEIHGDTAMGFPHDKTTHHFRLLSDGGAIEVTVNDPKDTQNLDAIRMHLRHVTAMFADGDFAVPMFVHSQTPPGVAEMTYRRGDITYKFEELATGGRVGITTVNQDALNAVHDFLIYQIRDHQTGDPERP